MLIRQFLIDHILDSDDDAPKSCCKNGKERRTGATLVDGDGEHALTRFPSLRQSG
jgi:hypothetical protein